MKNNTTLYRKGFTLIEVLLVIAIIAILAGIVVIAVDPVRQIAQARNAQRASDLNAIDKAIKQYYIDNQSWPPTDKYIPTALTEICDENGLPNGCINLNNLVPDYLSQIPIDPRNEGDGTNYFVALNNQQLQLTAPSSTVQGLPLIAVGTTTHSGGGAQVIWTCGDPTNVECWSSNDVNKVWGPANGTFAGVSTDMTVYNGKENTEILYNLGDIYEAAYYCYKLTETVEGQVPPEGTWYLPSYAELLAGWQAQQDGEFSGVFINNAYVSSTEVLNGPNSFWVWLAQQQAPGQGYKPAANNVRCLR